VLNNEDDTDLFTYPYWNIRRGGRPLSSTGGRVKKPESLLINVGKVAFPAKSRSFGTGGFITDML
jgi:hypothetical protein